MLGAGDIYAPATDKPESFDVVRYTGSAEYGLAIANSRNELGPNKNLDLALVEDPFLRLCSSCRAPARCSASTAPT